MSALLNGFISSQAGVLRQKDHLVISPAPPRAALGPLAAVLGSVLLLLRLALCPRAAERALGLLQVRQGHALQGDRTLPVMHRTIEPHSALAWKGP